MCVYVFVCVCEDCEDIKHSAKKQEQGAAGRNVFNQVRTKELCNFLLRAVRTRAFSEREQSLFFLFFSKEKYSCVSLDNGDIVPVTRWNFPLFCVFLFVLFVLSDFQNLTKPR